MKPVFDREGVGTVNKVPPGVVWCHCLVRCQGTGSRTHRSSCTPSADVHVANKADSFLVVLGKGSPPHRPRGSPVPTDHILRTAALALTT